MPKYIPLARPPRAWFDEDEPPRTMTIIVEDGGPIDTGLFDATGTRLYRVSDRIPIGFKA